MKMKPADVIAVRLGIDPNGRAQRFLTQTCYNHMDKYVPIDTGDLRSNVVLTADEIRYVSPYAHYMYEGKVMGPNIPITKKGVAEPTGWFSPKGKAKSYTGANIIYHTAGTGHHWADRMKSAEMQEVVKEVQAFIKRG